MPNRIAQSCPYCKEFFITENKLLLCPFCYKELPVIKPKPKIQVLTPTEAPSTEIIKEFMEVQNQVSLLYNLVYGFLSKNNEQIKSKKLNNETLCDFGFICRELENIFDELRKEVKARKELCGNIIAFRITQAIIADPSIEMKTEGQLAIGIPDVKMQAALPEKFTAEYYQLTDYFKVPRQIAEIGILKLDWKVVTEFLTKQMNEGKTIPKGFGKQYPVYITTYRKKQEEKK